MATTNPAVGVFWDMEGCPPSKHGSSASTIPSRIHKAASRFGDVEVFKAYGFQRTIDPPLASQLTEDIGASVVDVSARATASHLLEDIMFFALSQEAKKTDGDVANPVGKGVIMLVFGGSCSNLVTALPKLADQGFIIALVVPQGAQVTQELSSCAVKLMELSLDGPPPTPTKEEKNSVPNGVISEHAPTVASEGDRKSEEERHGSENASHTKSNDSTRKSTGTGGDGTQPSSKKDNTYKGKAKLDRLSEEQRQFVEALSYALDSLKRDGMVPSQATLRARLIELDGTNWKKLDERMFHSLLTSALLTGQFEEKRTKAGKSIILRAGESMWSAIDVLSTANPFELPVWESFKAFLLAASIGKLPNPKIGGIRLDLGKYHLAKWLHDEGLDVIRSLTLGECCHLVQLATLPEVGWLRVDGKSIIVSSLEQLPPTGSKWKAPVRKQSGNRSTLTKAAVSAAEKERNLRMLDDMGQSDGMSILSETMNERTLGPALMAVNAAADEEERKNRASNDDGNRDGHNTKIDNDNNGNSNGRPSGAGAMDTPPKNEGASSVPEPKLPRSLSALYQCLKTLKRDRMLPDAPNMRRRLVETNGKAMKMTDTAWDSLAKEAVQSGHFRKSKWSDGSPLLLLADEPLWDAVDAQDPDDSYSTKDWLHFSKYLRDVYTLGSVLHSRYRLAKRIAREGDDHLKSLSLGEIYHMTWLACNKGYLEIRDGALYACEDLQFEEHEREEDIDNDEPQPVVLDANNGQVLQDEDKSSTKKGKGKQIASPVVNVEVDVDESVILEAIQKAQSVSSFSFSLNQGT